jgi:hypothetical protein
MQLNYSNMSIIRIKQVLPGIHWYSDWVRSVKIVKTQIQIIDISLEIRIINL